MNEPLIARTSDPSGVVRRRFVEPAPNAPLGAARAGDRSPHLRLVPAAWLIGLAAALVGGFATVGGA